MPWSFRTKRSGTVSLPSFRRQRYTINDPDPLHQVVYLGNVLTVMAKGDGCVDKPLNLIWKTHMQRTRPDLHMKLSVTRSGLKAETKLQGLTEYWAHRITYCVAPPDYPRVFCWIYKHEGKKMKPELRCHAVLCRKAVEPPALALRLHDTLHAALREYKREKISRQNTRLSGTLAGYPTLPRRKILLSTGSINFRPPMSRSKSAPRLGSIEEHEEEEEEEEGQQLTAEEEEDLVEELLEPGTPRELEFAEVMERGVQIPAPHLLSIDLEIGNDIDKLRLEERVMQLKRRKELAEPDSISDESGYHEKSSLEGEEEDEEPEVQVTSL